LVAPIFKDLKIVTTIKWPSIILKVNPKSVIGIRVHSNNTKHSFALF